MLKYFIYARKSTDSEDRQILSIEAQLVELREFARRENLSVITEFCEARTAKEPGRQVFNDLVRRLERGEANALLSWHPDRLARNSMDGGKIIYLTDTGKLMDLRFPTYRFDNTAQGKFMLSIIFGQSKYFIDNLSENVKRGFRQKLRRGEYPGFAPLGYKNNTANHTIEIVPEIAAKIRELFELYATGRYSISSLKKLAAASGLASRRKHLPLSISNVERILKNSFYYGAFKFGGELHESTHPPIITKELFDRAQEAFKLHSKPRINGPHYHVFRGFIKCGECGCSITSEIQKKRYIYYRCSKKRGVCATPFMREEALVDQINEAANAVAISNELKDFLMSRINEEGLALSTPSPFHANDFRITEIDIKLNKLLNAFLDQLISEYEFKEKKSELLNEKIRLKENLEKANAGEGKAWLELARNFVSNAGQAGYIAKNGDLEEKREFIKKIGSNFRLCGPKLSLELRLPYASIGQNLRKEKWGG
ncbi:MAG: recombinase family protein [Candidatus Omnitrophica bacterium]|nr:recombinase family protein [Candidatus Omnitrophota bacterium]MBU1929836.1 recombinase family protein [Candidatus Omnitrophota bacterium]MBU2035316.1 recombinase family protein [Candidatus Omnitrophota bacterium]MBU2257503.1 recombinase family protein [Candidatus Omnitrophota bacterium]